MMIGFIAGMFLGCAIGVLIMAIVAGGKDN